MKPFVLQDEVAKANEIFYPQTAAEHDAAEHQRKFAIALRCAQDDGDRESGWARRWEREYAERINHKGE